MSKKDYFSMLLTFSMLITSNSNAAELALDSISTSGLGNANAGAAADAKDPSSIYFNPALLSKLEGQQSHITLYKVSSKLATSNNKLKIKDKHSILGSASLTKRLNDKYSSGFAVTVPFAFKTDKYELHTINYGLYLAHSYNNHSFGIAVIGQQIETRSMPNPRKVGKDLSLAWNLGFLYDITEKIHAGLSYRSYVEHTIKATYPQSTDESSTKKQNYSDLTLPDSLSFSFSYDVSDKLRLLADATLTKWERYSPDKKSQWRYSIGATFKLDSKQTYRIGLALDESATRSTDTIEDTSLYHLIENAYLKSDRLLVSLGIGFKISDTIGLDIGYAHVFFDDTAINIAQKANGTSPFNVEPSVDILSTQINFKF